MDNIIGTQDQKLTHRKAARAGSVRIAYSINNQQPVKSTYIAEEPLFYIDEGNLDDDEYALDDETFELIEKELKTLEHDLSIMDKNARRNLKEERILEFMADSSFLDESRHALNSAEIQARITDMVSQSRMAKTLLAFAEKKNITLKVTDQVSSVFYDKKGGAILIRDDLDFNTQILLTIEALRQVWQDHMKASKHPLAFHPDHAVLVGRAQAADIKTCLMRCVWELKLTGQTQFWEMLENSHMADLARTFSREALSDFRNLDNGKAACSVFEAWFLSERCGHQDTKLIQAMLAENNNFVFENVEKSYSNLTRLIMNLGTQPYGKNYLARFTDLIINDPLFTDVRDRSNANFLWFVKFERAYNEAEQDLHNGVVTRLPGIEPVQKTKKDTIYEQQSIAGRENIFDASQYTGENVIVVDFVGQSINQEERLF